MIWEYDSRKARLTNKAGFLLLWELTQSPLGPLWFSRNFLCVIKQAALELLSEKELECSLSGRPCPGFLQKGTLGVSDSQLNSAPKSERLLHFLLVELFLFCLGGMSHE